MSTLEEITLFRAVDYMSPSTLYRLLHKAAARRSELSLEAVLTFLLDKAGGDSCEASIMSCITQCVMFSDEHTGPEVRLLFVLVDHTRWVLAFNGMCSNLQFVPVPSPQPSTVYDCNAELPMFAEPRGVVHTKLCLVRTLYERDLEDAENPFKGELNGLLQFMWWANGFRQEICALATRHTSSSSSFI